MPSDTTPPLTPSPTTSTFPGKISSTNNAETKPFTVCVFCGASSGNNPAFLNAARGLAGVLAKNKWSLVYGGGNVGLMGALASSLVKLGGKVHGIIPNALIMREVGGDIPPESEFGRTTVVKDMHTRKAMMGWEADAFVAMPGGYGTLEELFEVITWNQLGIHDCPIVILNVDGFYDGLLQWVDKAVDYGLISNGNRTIVVEAKTVEEVAEQIKTYTPAEDRLSLDWSAQ